jgi:hypothetical protein
VSGNTLSQQHFVLFCDELFRDILTLGKNLISLILNADINMKYRKYLTRRIGRIYKLNLNKFKKNVINVKHSSFNKTLE